MKDSDKRFFKGKVYFTKRNIIIKLPFRIDRKCLLIPSEKGIIIMPTDERVELRYISDRIYVPKEYQRMFFHLQEVDIIKIHENTYLIHISKKNLNRSKE